MNDDPIVPSARRRPAVARLAPHASPALAALAAPNARHLLDFVVRIDDAVPAVLHVRDAAAEGLLAEARRPVVAGLDPLLHEVLRSGLEKVRAAAGEGEGEAVRAVAVVAGGRERGAECMSEGDLSDALRVRLAAKKSVTASHEKDERTHSPVSASQPCTSFSFSSRPSSIEAKHPHLALRNDDKDLKPVLLLRALPDRFPEVLAPEDALLRPGSAEQSELLVRDGHAAVALVVVLLLLANDGVREAVGEADGRDLVMRRRAVGRAGVVLRGAGQ